MLAALKENGIAFFQVRKYEVNIAMPFNVSVQIPYFTVQGTEYLTRAEREHGDPPFCLQRRSTPWRKFQQYVRTHCTVSKVGIEQWSLHSVQYS
jgi:hypothetical protein